MSETLTMSVTLDSAGLREKLARVSGKDLKKAILRGGDAGVALIVERLRGLIDAEEPKYFKSRRKGMLKDYRRWARRLRGHFESGNTAASSTSTRTVYAAALEDGGSYTQYVKPYERKLTQAWGRPVERPRAVQVGPYTRQREEFAKHYLARAVYAVAPRFTTPLERALRALFEEDRVPTQAELKRGLS